MVKISNEGSNTNAVNQSGSYMKYPKYLEYEEIHLG